MKGVLTMAKRLTTSLRTEILEDYKRLVTARSTLHEVPALNLNVANVILDILEIYEEKINED